jgi:hypothetical protein
MDSGLRRNDGASATRGHGMWDISRPRVANPLFSLLFSSFFLDLSLHFPKQKKVEENRRK